MKRISAVMLSNMAYSRLVQLTDKDLSAAPPVDLNAIEEAEFMLDIKRALSEGKKRITIDVKY